MKSEVLILAGGRGTRIAHLIDSGPKALTDINGKPALLRQMEWIKQCGFVRTTLSLGYKADEVIRTVGPKAPLLFDYVIEEEPLGTAGGIKFAGDKLAPDFAVVSCDIVVNFDLRELLKVHKAQEGLATILLTQVENVERYGVVELDGNIIKRFVEKPSRHEAPSKWINTGIYALDKRVLEIVGPGKVSIEREIFPKLAAEGVVQACFLPKDKYWIDLGTPESLDKLRRDHKEGKIQGFP